MVSGFSASGLKNAVSAVPEAFSNEMFARCDMESKLVKQNS